MTTLAELKLAFIPLPSQFRPANAKTVDAWMSVSAGFRFLWVPGGMVVRSDIADRAREELIAAVIFASQADALSAKIKREAEETHARLQPKKGKP